MTLRRTPGSSATAASREAAPRSLNEPVRCRFSSFSQISAPVLRPSDGAGTSGVTRASRRTRFATSPPVASRQISGSNSRSMRLGQTLSSTDVRQRGRTDPMSFVALDQLVRRGHLPEDQAARVAWLWDEIRRLKREKRAFIPAHNYQVPEVQAIADLVGDSFELAVKARDLDASQGALVVFCGVRFMAEGCYTLAPERPVYLPSLDALCSLAEVDADDVAERQDFLRAAGRRFATMTYVNTYADVKALSDTCCTSSNAARIADKLGVPDLLFVPDQNLAYQVALKTKRTYLPPPEPNKFPPREYEEMIKPITGGGAKGDNAGTVVVWARPCHVPHQM